MILHRSALLLFGWTITDYQIKCSELGQKTNFTINFFQTNLGFVIEYKGSDLMTPHTPSLFSHKAGSGQVSSSEFTAHCGVSVKKKQVSTFNADIFNANNGQQICRGSFDVYNYLSHQHIQLSRLHIMHFKGNSYNRHSQTPEGATIDIDHLIY